jgi:hypothetical protein
MNKETVIKLIDKMIQKYQKYYDEKGICWLCYESDTCYHSYKIDALNELKKNLEHPEEFFEVEK